MINNPPADIDEVLLRWRATGMPPENLHAPGDEDLIWAYLRDWTMLIDASSEEDRVGRLNAMLRRYTSPPTITDHDGSGWHLHFRPDGASAGEVIAASTTVAAANHLTIHGMHRLGRCALAECDRAFVDRSRPGRQRYCTHACANRDAVRRHRAAR